MISRSKIVSIAVWNASKGLDVRPEAMDIQRVASKEAEDCILIAAEEWYQTRFQNGAAPKSTSVYAYAMIVDTGKVFKVRLSWSLKFQAEDMAPIQAPAWVMT